MEENGNLVRFIFNPDREAVTEEDSTGIIRLIRGSALIARNTDAARTYYHYASDEMGFTTHIVDENGNVQNRYEYDAWGNLTAQEEAIPNRFKYTGQQLDPVTQQYYLRARFYNPVIARFTQEDTYRGDGLNLYAYCANNPVLYVDPSGNWCESKQNVFERLAKDRGIDLNNIDYDTQTRLMAEASNIVKQEKRNNNYSSATTEPIALPNQMQKPHTETPTMQSATGGGSGKGLNRRLININGWNGDVNDPFVRLYGTYNELRNAGVKDAHHIIQDASVRDVTGYKKGDAPAIQADGPSTKMGSEHYNLTYDQSHATKGGTYGIEKDIGLNSIKNRLGLSKDDLDTISDYLDDYFIGDLGLNNNSVIKIPGNRHQIGE